MLPMLPMLRLDVTLQIARKTNVHAGCDRTHLNFHRTGGGETRLKSIPAQTWGKAVGKAGKGWERLTCFPAAENGNTSDALTLPITTINQSVLHSRTKEDQLTIHQPSECDGL